MKIDVAETVRQSILACEYGKAQQEHGPEGGPFVASCGTHRVHRISAGPPMHSFRARVF